MVFAAPSGAGLVKGSLFSHASDSFVGIVILPFVLLITGIKMGAVAMRLAGKGGGSVASKSNILDQAGNFITFVL